MALALVTLRLAPALTVIVPLVRVCEPKVVVVAPSHIATTLLAAAGLQAAQAECTSHTSMAAPPMACNRTRRKPAGLTPSMFTFGFGQRTKTGRFVDWTRI